MARPCVDLGAMEAPRRGTRFAGAWPVAPWRGRPILLSFCCLGRRVVDVSTPRHWSRQGWDRVRPPSPEKQRHVSVERRKTAPRRAPHDATARPPPPTADRVTALTDPTSVAPLHLGWGGRIRREPRTDPHPLLPFCTIPPCSPGFPVPSFLKAGVTDAQAKAFTDQAVVYVNKFLGAWTSE